GLFDPGDGAAHALQVLADVAHRGLGVRAGAGEVEDPGELLLPRFAGCHDLVLQSGQAALCGLVARFVPPVFQPERGGGQHESERRGREERARAGGGRERRRGHHRDEDRGQGEEGIGDRPRAQAAQLLQRHSPLASITTFSWSFSRSRVRNGSWSTSSSTMSARSTASSRSVSSTLSWPSNSWGSASMLGSTTSTVPSPSRSVSATAMFLLGDSRRSSMFALKARPSAAIVGCFSRSARSSTLASTASGLESLTPRAAEMSFAFSRSAETMN